MSDSSSPSPRVRLSHGGVARGAQAAGVACFRGLPYAVSPEGELRFASPRQHPGWAGERDATTAGQVATQWPRGGHVVVGEADCLRLNVWTPADMALGGGWPVLVWVHGGGFMRGSASEALCDGTVFARAGIVVIALQYRLGMDGFMDLPGVAGNRGLQDLLAGLRWVQREARAFGGDPGRVTLAGQSAGAGAVACLASMNAAQGLFDQLVLQSPSVTCHTREDAVLARHAVAQVLQTLPTLDAMAAQPVACVVRAVQRLAADAALRRRLGLGARHFFPLRPVIDGEGLSDAPVAALRRIWSQGRGPRAVLVGANAQEMRLYHVPTDALARLTLSDLREFAGQMGLPPSAIAEVAGSGDIGERLCQLQTDGYYRAPARHLAEASSAAGQATFLYEFAWHSPQYGGRLGAAHGVELPFVFDTRATAMGRELAGDSAPASLAHTMSQAWIRFVHHGDPGWSAYVAQDPCAQQFDTQSACVRLPREAAWLALWEAVA